MDSVQIPNWVLPGRSFHLYFGPDNPENRKIHVRGFVDGRVIVRSWCPKRRWIYEVLDSTWFLANNDLLRPYGETDG